MVYWIESTAYTSKTMVFRFAVAHEVVAAAIIIKPPPPSLLTIAITIICNSSRQSHCHEHWRARTLGVIVRAVIRSPREEICSTLANYTSSEFWYVSIVWRLYSEMAFVTIPEREGERHLHRRTLSSRALWTVYNTYTEWIRAHQLQRQRPWDKKQPMKQSNLGNLNNLSTRKAHRSFRIPFSRQNTDARCSILQLLLY